MIYLGLLLTCLIGWVLLPPKMELGLTPKVSLAFAAGVAAISIQMFAYDLAGMGWSLPALLLPWAGVAVFAAYRHRTSILHPIWPPRTPNVTGIDILLFLVVLVPLLIGLPYERLMPLQAWDAWAIWFLKAKVFYLDGNLDGFFTRHREFTTQSGYPLLVPLYGTFLYAVNGGVADYAAKILSPCSFVALLGVFHYFSRRWVGNTVALACTALVATTPMVGQLAFEYAGYADATLSLYLVAAAGFLYEWVRGGRLIDLAGASLAATAAAWTKNEGQFFLLAVLAVAAAALILRKQSLRAWALLVGPPLTVLIPWSLLRESYGIQAAGFVVGWNFRLDLFWTALQALLTKALAPDLFVLTFVVFFAVLVAAKPLGVPLRFWVLPALTVWHVLGALLAYSTGRNEIHWWLETSGGRILAQIAPVALLAPAALVSHWMGQASGEGESASAAARPRKKPLANAGEKPARRATVPNQSAEFRGESPVVRSTGSGR